MQAVDAIYDFIEAFVMADSSESPIINSSLNAIGFSFLSRL